tara:strand:+ start:96 stop:947 length:852 start_codon:yes stop_codon:yes gene_type:complete
VLNKNIKTFNILLKMTKILLVGYGKMGSSLARGWLKKKLKIEISVIEKEKVLSSKKNNIIFYNSFEDYFEAKKSPDIILIAIKPQQLKDIIVYLNKIYKKNIIFISVVAGISTAWFKEKISKEIKIVRAMPNLPSSVLSGVTGIYNSRNILKKEIENIKIILKSIGEIILLKNEKLIDIVTSISGSGPAYYFYLTEVLTEVGVKLGLKKNEAEILAYQTFVGSAKLLKETKQNFSKLRKDVTSPGGTTEAALSILMNDRNGLNKIFTKALSAALTRAKELGNS